MPKPRKTDELVAVRAKKGRLLHLARCPPNQWPATTTVCGRTVAVIVSGTTRPTCRQCAEHVRPT